MDLHGIGPSGAARLLVEVGDITRFPNRDHFASWNGTAPIDASSGDNVRHRLSRAGNRQINRVLHIMATVQLRNDTEGRAYFDRRKAEGKTSMEAMRSTQTKALEHRLQDHARRRRERRRRRAREGNEVATLTPARPAHNPNTGSSEKPLRGPSPPSLERPPSGVLTQRGARSAHSRTDRGARYYSCNYQQYLAKNPYGYRCHANTGVPFPTSA